MPPLNTYKEIPKMPGTAPLQRPASSAPSRTFVYVSNAADGTLSSYQLSAKGQLQPLATLEAGAGAMSLALSPDRSKLYASIRGKPFTLATYDIDPANGVLTLVTSATAADSLVYISTDNSGRYLFGASYGDDLLSVNAINAEGVVSDNPQHVIETGPSAHSIIVDASNRFVYATILGADQLLAFNFDPASGALTPLATVQLPQGSGPRHPVLSADSRFLYLLNEMTASVSTFAIAPKAGNSAHLMKLTHCPKARAWHAVWAGPCSNPGNRHRHPWRTT